MNCLSSYDRTLYRYGSLDSGHFGYVALAPDGRVRAYSHPNERRYRLEDGRLNFIDEYGKMADGSGA